MSGEPPAEHPVLHSDPAFEHARASDILRAIADNATGEAVTVRQMMDAFGERGYGLLMILFSLPNLVPSPGIGEIFGIPLFLIGYQMLVGRPTPWLPPAIERRGIRRTTLVRIVNAVEPRLRRIEAILKPRLTVLFSNRMDRAVGLFTLLCSISIIIPFPGTNFPVAIATVLIALAVMAEDGVVLIIGATIAAAGLTYTFVVVGGIAWLGILALTKMVVA